MLGSARPSRRLGATLAILAAALLTSACGSQPGTSTPGGSTQSSGPSTGTTSTAGAPGKVAFPLTLQRTGGIAGVHDTIVITDTGKVIVQKSNATPGYVCQLTDAARPKIEGAISGLDFGFIAPPPVEKSEIADAFLYSLTAADGKEMHGSDVFNPIDRTLIALLNEAASGDGSGNTLCIKVPAAS